MYLEGGRKCETLDVAQAMGRYHDRRECGAYHSLLGGRHVAWSRARISPSFPGCWSWTVGLVQSRLLRGQIPARTWVGATALGFVGILVPEAVERHAVVGPHAGPLEPLMIGVAGSTFAGMAQLFVLRHRGVPASRWLGFWVIGVLAGMAVAVAAVIDLEATALAVIEGMLSGPVGEAVSGGVMLLIIGVITGAVSAGALRRSLSVAPPR